MIESIVVSGVATFGRNPEEIQALSLFNFFFGANGTGKTTVSRVIAGEDEFPTCNVKWKAGTRLQPLVYNHDFVERNFNQSAQFKGVFMLGEKQVDTLTRIAKAKGEVDALTGTIETLTQGLRGSDGQGGKLGERAALVAGLKEKCWAQKQKHDAKLQGGLEGYRNSSEKFKDKVLQELAANNASLLTLEELTQKAESVFGATPAQEEAVPSVATVQLLAYEEDPILTKRVIGKDDVDVAAMIKRLGNSDWVREGRAFYDTNGRVCPFCQEKTSELFSQSLEEYFDETFVADSKAIDSLADDYAAEADKCQKGIASIIESPSKFLDVEKLKTQKELLDARLALNRQRLADKKKEASRVVRLESLSNVFVAVKGLVDQANVQVAAHNKMVANLGSERRALTEQIWKFVLEELKPDLAAFTAALGGLDKAILAMTERIANAEEERARKESVIRELQKHTTSVQPTMDGINALLASFGFQGFKLAKAADGISYKLVRSDGSDAKATLSEGEKTFVTFLYFYYLLKGSDSESGVMTDRIVVFDDPVSSLDSEILFIVGSLIKGLFVDVRSGEGQIKQVFVLTHNVYFHKEVTYNPKRKNGAMKEESFWIVRKSGQDSRVDSYPANPIKTSYELLWAELRSPDRSNLSVQNTMRRILENYFKILGGIDFDQLCAMFEGKEKIVCKSLCSWVHDGSHYAHDDLYVSIDDSTVDSYLKVFRDIFRKSDHIAHYKMMMGDAYAEDASTAAPA